MAGTVPSTVPARPLGPYLAALAAGGVVPILVVATLAEFDFADSHPMVFAAAVSAAIALAFGLKWPQGTWKWGLWVSGGFGVLLILAFIGLFRIGRLDAHPLVEALGVTLAGCAGGEVGSRLTSWRLSRVASAESET